MSVATEAASSGAPYTATVLHRFADFLALEPEWRELHAAAERPLTWQRHRWLRLSWEMVWRRPFNRLRIILIRDRSGRLVMAGAFVVYFYRLVPTVEFLGSGTPQNDDVLRRPSPDTAEQAALLLETLIRRRGGAPMLRLARIRDDSPLRDAIIARGLRRRVKDEGGSPYLRLADFPDYESYIAGLSKNVRSDHRRRVRRLAEMPGYSYRYDTGETAREALRWSFVTKRDWLDRRGRTAGWLTSGLIDRFLLAYLDGSDDIPETWVATMRVGDRIIANGLCFVEGDIVNFFKVAHDPEHGKHSPGRTLSLNLIGEAYARGMAEFEMGNGTVEWKRRLTSRERIVSSERVWLR